MTFQQKVLNLVKKIPKGKLTTYKIIAKALNKKAYRAVGQALKQNKTPIIIPCHRVVCTNGSIGGYSRGIKEKTRLLRKEGIIIKENKIQNFKQLHYKF